MEKEKIEETIIFQPAAAGPVVATAARFASFNRGGSSKWLVFGSSLLGSFFLTFAGFLLLDAVFNPNAAAAAAAAGDDNYPRLAADLPGRVDMALNNQNLSAPGGLLMLFDNKLNSTGSAGAAPAAPVFNQIQPRPLPSGFGGGGYPNRGALPSAFPTPVPLPGSNPSASVDSPYPNSSAPATVSAAVLERLRERQNAVRRNEPVPAVWEAYDIEDVVPMGVVGDEKSRDVGFYSMATKQRFSAPIGARFNNGTLVGAALTRGDVVGVRFRSSSTGATFVRLFARGKNGKEVEESSILPDRAADPTTLTAVPTPEEARPLRSPPAKRRTARRGNN